MPKLDCPCEDSVNITLGKEKEQFLKNEKNKNIRCDLVSDCENYMQSFRENIGLIRTRLGWSVRVLAEKANMSEDTLQNFLKGKSKDCNLSTAVKLARAFGLTIDELVGCGTMDPITKESIALFSELPKGEQNVIRWLIRNMNKEYQELPQGTKAVRVMTPKCVNGSLETTKEWEYFTINNLPSDVQPKVFMGFRVPCVHYMPVYSNGDILLIANDRMPISGEHCVVKANKNLYIVRCKRVGGKVEYFSIIKDIVKAVDSNAEVVGYVAYVVKENEDDM